MRPVSQPHASLLTVMSNDTLKAKKKLSALSSSLDDLESSLSTLLSQSLPEQVLGLDTIQQAKLQVVIPYLVYDLVFSQSQTSPPLLPLSAYDPTNRLSL